MVKPCINPLKLPPRKRFLYHHPPTPNVNTENHPKLHTKTFGKAQKTVSESEARVVIEKDQCLVRNTEHTCCKWQVASCQTKGRKIIICRHHVKMECGMP